MEQKELRAFTAAAECGSFSKAAERLFVSRSAVSRSVAALEEELGCLLFDRSGVCPMLTPAGKTLLEGVRRLTAEEEALERAVREAARTGE